MNFKNRLLEDKTSIIKNRLVLPDIEDNKEKEEFKSTLIDFFKKHPNYENKIDWNKAKSLTRNDFREVLDLEGISKNAQKKDIQSDVRNIFKSIGERKFLIVGENDNWLFVAPLTYKAAVYCDSSENQGAGAKWCIGYEKDDGYWNDYIDEGNLFIMAFNKNFKSLSPEDIRIKLKYMIQRDGKGEYHIWNQEDIDTGSDLEKVGTKETILEEMFETVNLEIAKELESLKKKTNEKVEEILRNCGEEIDEDTIPEKYRKNITKVQIPDSVKSIGWDAFYNCKVLTSVKISNSVTSIGGDAFYGCNSLTSVTIPNSVTSIGQSAFFGCKSLISVTIPNSVTSIGWHAFDGCIGLEFVEIPDSVKSIGSLTFYKCNPNIVIIVSKDFDRSLLKDVGLPETARFKIID